MIPTSATAARTLLETAALIGGLQSGRCDQTVKHQCHLALLESCGLYAAARVSEPKVLALRRVFSAVRSEPPALALEELVDHDAQIPLRYLRAQTEPAGENAGGGSRKDASLLQARRDIQRDTIVINGVKYTGATEGYEGIVSRIQQAFEFLEATCFGGSQTPADAIVGDSPARQRSRSAALAAQLLRVCNRTISGGDAYEAAAHVLSSAATAPHFADALAADAGMGAAALGATIKGRSHAAEGCGLTLVPDSAGAAPLELHLDVGPFQFAPHEVQASAVAENATVVDGAASPGSDDGTASGAAAPADPPFFIGLRCLVRGTTAYWVLREDADFATVVPLLKSGGAGRVAPPSPPLSDDEHGDSEATYRADRRNRHATGGHTSTRGTSRHRGRPTNSDGEEDDDEEDAVEADGWKSLQPASHRRGKSASAAASAAAAALRGEGRARGWARQGYFGRLEATYVRRLAALPTCVLDRPSHGVEPGAPPAAGGSSTPTDAAASSSEAGAAAAEAVPLGGAAREQQDTPLMQAILKLAEDEVRRGKPPTLLEVAAALQAAAASEEAPAIPAAAPAGSASTAAGAGAAASAQAASAESDAADLPPYAGRLFDVGLEGHVVLHFSPADRL